MRKLAVLLTILSTAGAVLVAQRIPTNPKPEAHLRKLFPDAAEFSRLDGSPLHFKAYAADPRANLQAALVGVAFWTTDLVPRERGYHGAIHLLVGMEPGGKIAGVIVDWDDEPYGYFSVKTPEFAAQFRGKNPSDPFWVGADVDAVSRATITISSAARAIRDSSRMVASRVLGLKTP